MINSNNAVSSCPKKNNNLQTFELEALILGKGFYQYHLEIDFFGIVTETLLFKNRNTQKYKSILSATRVKQTVNCNENDENCISKNNETLESEMYSLADFPEIRYETTKIYEFYMKGILEGTAFE